MVKFTVKPYFLQPIGLRAFLCKKSVPLSNQYKREYYLSYEDALWNLIPRFGFKKGCKFLVPELYCIDVINNMKSHGYKVAFYPMNSDFTCDKDAVINAINKEKPDIFVEFAVDGLATSLATRIRDEFPTVFVIYDRVHTLVNPTKPDVKLDNNSLLLNSYRKVSPLPGNLAVYTRNITQSKLHLPIIYTFRVLLLWSIYIAILRLSRWSKSVWLAVYAENVLKSHDDLVGDAKYSYPLPRVVEKIYLHIDFEGVAKCKLAQAKLYSSILPKEDVDHVPGILASGSAIRGFPLVLPVEKARKFMQICRAKGFLVVSQLDDSPWAKHQKAFYLPLGPHLKSNDIVSIANTVKEALTQLQ